MRDLPRDVVSLIHYIELTKAGWYNEFLERCTFAVLWMNEKSIPMQKIKMDISRKLGAVVRGADLQEVLDKLEDSGQIIKLHDGRYKLSIDTHQYIKGKVESFDKIEQATREKFCKGVQPNCEKQDPLQIWNLFIDRFLIPLVDNEGARSYELLVGKNRGRLVDIISYVDSFLEKIPISCKEKISQFVTHFLSSDDIEITQFFLSYLDAYFILSVSGLPSVVVNKLSEISRSLLEFVIFLDTNFIFSILGLHSNPSNEAAKDLMELAESISSNIRIQFVVKRNTLEETQQAITYHRKRLENITYPPNVAEATTFIEISGIFKTFFERVAASGHSVNAVDYFAPYENNLVRMLREKGITVFSEESGKVKYEQTLDVIEDIETQRNYECEKYGDGAKSEQQITHDIILWHFVQNLRDPTLNVPLEVKYWIVTVDYRFLSFDKYKTSNSSLLSACIHPSQLIQVLRFFVPRSPQFEKTLLGVVKLPVMSRAFDPESERISIHIAKNLARYTGIDDVNVDTLVHVLADDALRVCLSSPLSEEEEIKAIQNALTRQITKQETIISEQTEKIGALEIRVDELDTDLKQYIQKEQRHRLIQNETETKKQEAEKQAEQLALNLKRVEFERDRYNFLFRLIIGLIVAVIGIATILILPEALSLSWLIEHPNRLGLQLSAILFVIGVSWGVIDNSRTRRYIALGSLVIGAILVIAQLISSP